MQSPDAQLRRLHGVKQIDQRVGAALGPAMVEFFKQSVEKRHSRLGKIAECWGRLVPEILLQHCALESFSRGSLTVIVDSASHLYELKQLLLAGLEKQIFLACKSTGLRKINLKAGRWYDGEAEHERKPRFA